MNTIIFDMDGVLIDTETICARAWREISGQYQLTEVEDDILVCLGMNHADTEAHFCSRYGQDFPYQDFHRESSAVFYRLADVEGIPLKPGVNELLAFLQEADYRIGLASSSREQTVRTHLERYDLLRYFEAIITGDMVRHSKPDPEIYIRACQMMDTAPARAIAVEDSFNGIRSARCAGMNVIMVPDLRPPDKAISEMLYGCYESLIEVRNFFRAGQNRSC